MAALEAAWGLLQLLLAAALVACGLYCGYIKYIHLKYDYIPGAPRASFLLGHLPSLWRLFSSEEVAYELFARWAEEHGPVLRMNAFHKVSLIILSPEGVKEYLMLPKYPKDREIYGRFQSLFGERFVGTGLAVDYNHEHWHKQRRIVDPAFSRTYLMGLMGIFNEKAEELMKVLEEKADGETEVNVMDLLRRVTLDIIAKVAFGLELNTLYDDQTPFPRAVSVVMDGVAKVRLPAFEYMPWNRKIVKEVQENVRLLRRTGKACIEERRKAMQNGEETPSDILTQILKTAAQEGDCDNESMLDNFVTFFFAGHETTANQLSFTIMELGRQPEIVAKLQAEVDEAIGSKRDISYEDLVNFRYLSQVLKESLRLYPPVPSTIRWTKTENIIEGVKIPANTSLLFNMYVMGRMERYFKDPLIFNPDRFDKEQPKQYYSYFPFSLGPRSCIGQTFSQMEAKVVMAKFLQRFEFQLVPPQSFKILDAGTLRPLDPVVCRLTLRNPLA